MNWQILATKLYVPPPPSRGIARTGLMERLTEGLHGRIILISAPPGFGKSTLVSAWIATHQLPAAWLSLDEGDSDLRRFFLYLIAALQTIAPQVGVNLAPVLDSAQLPPTELLLTSLLNDISNANVRLVLVLDDYHVIDAVDVDQALAFLVDHMPPTMHLAIVTREDPQLPLSRWRARGQLTELRAADLSLALHETALFLNQGMDRNLTMEQVTALAARTEGWIAGLQMALLSMRGRADVAQLIHNFTGTNRHILDYLIEEVLQRQPPSVRSFLLETSILERLCGPLCNAVTGRDDGEAMLEALERNNLFVIPLDDSRHWYRYHHLFATALAARATHQQPDRLTLLHQRASVWHEANGMAAEAIHHAFASKDDARVARLVELEMPELRRTRRESVLLGWLKRLPSATLRAHPLLNIHYAGVLMQSGMLEDVEDLLGMAEQALVIPVGQRDRGQDHEARGVPEQGDTRGLSGWIALYRAGYALMVQSVEQAAEYARQALALLPKDDHLGRGAASALLGIGLWSNGDLEAAYQTFAEGMAQVQRAGYFADAVGSAIILADIRIAQGRLNDARREYERGLSLATAHGGPPLRGAADMYAGLGALNYAQNDLEGARHALARCRSLGELAGLPVNAYRWRLVMARLAMAEGDLDAALVLLDEAERLYTGDYTPNVRPIAAFRVQVWLLQGKLHESSGWAQERALAARDDLTYAREFEHQTLARILLARARAESADEVALEAVNLLERLLRAAEQGRRSGSVIELLVLLALAHDVRGNLEAALASLERALHLAKPESHLRIFLDEGPPMALLLRKVAAGGIQPEYVQHLLHAWSHEDKSYIGDSKAQRNDAGKPLVEPLSLREIEVLRLFGTELSGPEIADRLVIALSTLRTHTKAIYGKLGVNSRRAAVNRARELDLL